MEAFIRTRTALLHVCWRDGKATPAEYRTASSFVLFMLLWVVVAIALILPPNYEMPPAKPATSQLTTSQQATYQQFTDRYRDPSMVHFLGE